MRLRSGNDEWWTPPDIVRRARAALGGIDCDPASIDGANQIVRATRFFTREQDGLTQTWSGRTWLNPPFSVGIVGRFVSKLIAEEAVTAWCCLLNNGTETKWGQKLLGQAQVVCFPASRIRFLGSDAAGKQGTPLQGQMIGARFKVAPAEGVVRFIEAFGPLGVVLPGGASIGPLPEDAASIIDEGEWATCDHDTALDTSWEHTVRVNGIRVDLVQPRESDRLKLLRAVAGITTPMARTSVDSRPLPRKPIRDQPQSPVIRGDRLRRALEKAAAQSPDFLYELSEEA